MHTGIGFAVPSNLAREVADQLIADGKFTRAWLGVGIRALKDDEDYLGLIKGVSDGVIVTQLQPGGPAAKSDLKAGDIITAVDGVAVGTAVQLKGAIRGKKIGAPVTLDVHRTGKNIKVKVKPEAWPDDTIPVVNRAPAAPAEKDTQAYGVTVQTVTKALAEKFGVEVKPGGIVTEVEPGSAAERKGIKPGDIIKLQRLNSGLGIKADQIFDKETADLIADTYQEDYEWFGFERHNFTAPSTSLVLNPIQQALLNNLRETTERLTIVSRAAFHRVGFRYGLSQIRKSLWIRITNPKGKGDTRLLQW